MITALTEVSFIYLSTLASNKTLFWDFIHSPHFTFFYFYIYIYICYIRTGIITLTCSNEFSILTCWNVIKIHVYIRFLICLYSSQLEHSFCLIKFITSRAFSMIYLKWRNQDDIPGTVQNRTRKKIMKQWVSHFLDNICVAVVFFFWNALNW